MSLSFTEGNGRFKHGSIDLFSFHLKMVRRPNITDTRHFEFPTASKLDRKLYVVHPKGNLESNCPGQGRS
jgi:hypothetical protein